MAFLLADLGVTKTHSRPHVSNDNPYSESQFRTLKYRPDFPETFGSIHDARAFCQHFFRWYNTEHYHSGIGWHHPIDVHYGRAEPVRAARADVLSAAYTRNPERFVRKHPEPPALPAAAWINDGGFYVACHQDLTHEDLDYMIEAITGYFADKEARRVRAPLRALLPAPIKEHAS